MRNGNRATDKSENRKEKVINMLETKQQCKNIKSELQKLNKSCDAMKLSMIVSSVVSAISFAILPFAINMAYEERGYYAIGSEYAFVIIGIICLFICITNALKTITLQNELISQLKK